MKSFTSIKVTYIAVIVLSSVFGTVPAALLHAQTGDKSLVISAFPAEVSLNPLRSYSSFEAQLYTALYEGLVIPDPVGLQPIPGAASRWEIDGDGTEYTFFLRENAGFSDGTRVTAQDFVHTFLAHLDPADPSPFSGFLDVVEGAREYRSGNGSRQKVRIEAVDDRTLQIRLTAPAPYFLDMLSHQSMTVIHPDQLAQENWHELESLHGSGPYQLESFTDDYMEFVPNPHYWDAHRIQLDRIRIDFSEDVQEVTERFNEGEIQWAMGNFEFSEAGNPDFILANPVFSTSFFFFNHRQEAYRNSRIRRGLTLLIPWEEIRTDQVYYTPTDQLVPQIPGYEKADSIHSQDVDAGLELLQTAGYPLGRGLADITIRIADGSEQNRIAQVYKQAIEEHTEITVHIEQMSAGEDYYSSLERNDYTIGNITWIGDYLDPLTFLMLFISDSGINNSAYENPEYDELIEAANRQENSERLSTLAKAEALLLQEGAVWPINHTVAFHLVNTEELEGWFPTALDLHPVKFLRRLEFLPGPGITRLEEFDEP